MAKMQCTTCGGTYETEQPRGTKYFHACPPVERVTVERAGKVSTIARDDVLEGDKVLEVTYEPRPDARDENVKVVDYTEGGSAVTAVKREGQGATPIADAAKR